jgi:hypothetical protein
MPFNRKRDTIRNIDNNNLLTFVSYNFYAAFFNAVANDIYKHFKLYDSNDPECPVNKHMFGLFTNVAWPSTQYGHGLGKKMENQPTTHNKYQLMRRIKCCGVFVCPDGCVNSDTNGPKQCPVQSGFTRKNNSKNAQNCKECKQQLVYQSCEAKLGFYVVCLRGILYGAVYVEKGTQRPSY